MAPEPIQIVSFAPRGDIEVAETIDNLCLKNTLSKIENKHETYRAVTFVSILSNPNLPKIIFSITYQCMISEKLPNHLITSKSTTTFLVVHKNGPCHQFTKLLIYQQHGSSLSHVRRNVREKIVEEWLMSNFASMQKYPKHQNVRQILVSSLKLNDSKGIHLAQHRQFLRSSVQKNPSVYLFGILRYCYYKSEKLSSWEGWVPPFMIMDLRSRACRVILTAGTDVV